MKEWKIVQYQPVAVDWYLADLQGIGSVLDIGCGDGDVLRSWANRGARTYALDRDERVLADNHLPSDTVRFCSDWYTWDPPPDWQVDLVYSALGPDLTSVQEIQKLNALSKRYVRLVVAADGKNSLLDDARVNWSLPKSKYGVNLLLDRLVMMGHSPQIKYATAECQWQISDAGAMYYVADQLDIDVEEVSLWLQKRTNGTVGLIEHSCITYARITWQVDESE